MGARQKELREIATPARWRSRAEEDTDAKDGNFNILA